MNDKRKNKAFIERMIKGRSVLAAYANFKIYRVHDIDFKKNPKSKIEGSDMTFMEYYKKNYGIRI